MKYSCEITNQPCDNQGSDHQGSNHQGHDNQFNRACIIDQVFFQPPTALEIKHRCLFIASNEVDIYAATRSFEQTNSSLITTTDLNEASCELRRLPFSHVLVKSGTLSDTELAQLRDSLDENTKLVLIESPDNTSLECQAVPEIIPRMSLNSFINKICEYSPDKGLRQETPFERDSFLNFL